MRARLSSLDSEPHQTNVWPRGERTAAAMESRLTSLESRIDQLLASVEDAQNEDTAPAPSKTPVNGDSEVQKECKD